MRRFRAVCAAILMAGAAGVSSGAQKPAPAGASTKLRLTVDTVMRGPDLVGWPPSAVRWSLDSKTLYFDWRKPGEKDPSTYAVGRDGGAPRKLSDADARHAPPPAGRWDKARRRLLSLDDGDVLVYDGASGRRIQVTRTTATESSPRWARNDTHVTYSRDGNLFIVPLEPGAPSVVTQLTDLAPRTTEPKLTDSQTFIRDEEQKLIAFVREQKAQKEKADEKAKKDKPPSFELRERQPRRT